MGEFKEEPIKVFIKIDNYNNIIGIESSVFLENKTGYIEVDSGYGNKYAHAQNRYLEKSLMNDDGGYNYKYVNGEILEN